jgi:penicillin-binding protein 1C
LRADEPILERRFLSPGSAYIIRQILRDHPRTDLPGGQVALAQSRRVAWKTGTSYGFRDAWALGVTDEYTLGVWVGRPDGTPSPGQYGRATAAPLLFLLVDGLPRTRTAAVPAPKYVDRVEICWPLGIRPSGPDDPFCHQRRMAYVLDGTIPPTLPDRADSFFQANPLTVQVNPETGLRVDADCPVAPTETIRIARWPQAAGPWLPPAIRKVSRPPRLDPACGRPASSAPEGIRIMDINPGTIFRPQGALRELPTVTLSAQGGRGRLFWMLGGRLIAETPVGRPAFFQFDRPGSFTLTVLDLSGDYDAVDIVVSAGNPDG